VAKNKIKQFAEVEQFENVVHHVQHEQAMPNHPLKGKWKKEFFKNNQPIILELGCGKGEYTLGLGRKNPSNNYIGVDLKGNRIWTGAKSALSEGLTNIAFLRTRIENIDTVFEKEEVDEIWITFPDPQPGIKREKKRLTSDRLIEVYRNVLKKDGIIHLKTDNAPFYEFSVEQQQKHGFSLIYKTSNLYTASDDYINARPELREIKTYYEKLFSSKGFSICYLCFRLA
jgi:tRNA (guanine-N7-)-methyltransferase